MHYANCMVSLDMSLVAPIYLSCVSNWQPACQRGPSFTRETCVKTKWLGIFCEFIFTELFSNISFIRTVSKWQPASQRGASFTLAWNLCQNRRGTVFSFKLSSTEVAVLATTFIEPINRNPEKKKEETDFEVETYARSSDCPFCQRITRLCLILHDILRAEKAACKCADNQCVCVCVHLVLRLLWSHGQLVTQEIGFARRTRPKNLLLQLICRSTWFGDWNKRRWIIWILAELWWTTIHWIGGWYRSCIPHICQFLDTTILFRPIKGAPKSV